MRFIRRTSSRARTFAAALVAALGIHACRSDAPQPSEPVLVGARSAALKTRLTVDGAGSTANGSVTSNRGGIACTISYSGGVVSLSGKCTQDYKTGTALTLTAQPAGGAVLSRWVGCTGASESALTCEVNMDVARRVSAVFSPPPSSFALRISGGAGGSGTVKSTLVGINCVITNGSAASTGCSTNVPAGQAVTLTATASTGSYLKAWAGAGCEAAGTGVGAGSGSCTLTVSQAQNVVVSFDTKATVASLGKWDAPITWPGVAIHGSLLPDGRVLTWGRMDRAPVLWSPATGAFGSTAHPVDFFCSGHSFLPNGRLLVAGGHSGTDNKGIRSTRIFDFATGSWSVGPDMQNGRWYPTNTTLANGEILTVSGGDTAQQRNLIPEVYQANGTWRVLSTASLYLPYYPFMYVAPDGRVFAAGPSQSTYYLDPTGTGHWTQGPSSHYGSRDYGSSVMYDPGKILIVGGGGPTKTAEVIDLNAGAGAAWRSLTSTMSVARRQTNATLLPDGKVLVTGGTNSSGFNVAPTTDAVLAAEVWDPSTEQWSTLGRMSHHRLYHSTALLLPDGRVLSVGSGQPAASGLTDDYTAEVYYPPYLFNADGTLAVRPTITSAPTQVAYGQSFTVGTPNASSIGKVTWISLGSVTHAFNENQRMNRLSFSVSGTSALTVRAPAGATLAPPGFYMLFLVDSRGVPSAAAIIRVS